MAVLRLRADAPAPEELDLDGGQWQRSSSLEFVLAPGGARLLRWTADTWQAS
jgi:hypothetical protein